MAFNFDSEDNIKSVGIPSVMVLSNMFLSKKGSAGLWICDDNVQSSGWYKTCNSNCALNCTDHYSGLTYYQHELRNRDKLEGYCIENPKILIIRSTALLKVDVETNRVIGVWKKGDGDITTDKGKKKFSCVKKYLLLFLDDNNKPTHKEPIQLTAKGCFMFHFENNLKNFKHDIKTIYIKTMKRKNGIMNDLWYSMCIFKPTFESKPVANGNNACIATGYTLPTENNWQSLIVGRDLEVNNLVCFAYNSTNNWQERYNFTSINQFRNESPDELYEE